MDFVGKIYNKYVSHYIIDGFIIGLIPVLLALGLVMTIIYNFTWKNVYIMNRIFSIAQK